MQLVELDDVAIVDLETFTAGLALTAETLPRLVESTLHQTQCGSIA